MGQHGTGAPAKDLEQAFYLRNRILKNEKRLRKWSRQGRVNALRLYDRDIPEVPLAIDLFRRTTSSTRPPDSPQDERDCLLLALYERPYDKDPALEEAWLALMATTAGEALGVDPDLVFARTRRRQRGTGQYERLAVERAERVVVEEGLSFIVNFSDYLDTGLFLDHRPTRARIGREARDRSVLNLFAYTGSFSVHAASGGASEVCSVDLSNTYLAWAGRNLALNGFEGRAWPLIRSDVGRFLAEARSEGRRWDLIVADPPTYSNSRSTRSDFDVNRDWPRLVNTCVELLSPEGVLYFSSNSRGLRWDPAAVHGLVEDISEESLPPDFRDRRTRRTWRIVHGNADGAAG
jgi:23S rRNA (cytosine1962-C5)-methyltransferase